MFSTEDVVASCIQYSQPAIENQHLAFLSFNHQLEKAPPDYDALKPFFAYLPTDIIKKTYGATTQFAKTSLSTVLKPNVKSPFPAFNVHQHNEPVATDTIFSNY